MKDNEYSDEYNDAIYYAELGSPTKGKRVIDRLIAEVTAIKDAECQAKAEKLLAQMYFKLQNVHIFDTFCGFNQVRIDSVFINENTELWQILKNLIGTVIIGEIEGCYGCYCEQFERGIGMTP